MNKALIIIGGGQTAEVAHYYFSRESAYDVTGFAVDRVYLEDDMLLGLPVWPLEDLETHARPDVTDVFVAFSFSSMNMPRRRKVEEMQARGYRLASFVHPRSEVWDDFVPGPNTLILENNTIQPYVAIGANTYLWSGNHIGHHTVIGAHGFIASHVVISGSVSIGEHGFFGVNCTVRDNVSIGDHVLVGAGAVVLEDVADRAVIPGLGSKPARITSDRLKRI